VSAARASLRKETVTISFDPARVGREEMVQIVQKLGYEASAGAVGGAVAPRSAAALSTATSPATPPPANSAGADPRASRARRTAGVLVLILALFVLAQMLGVNRLASSFPLVSQDAGYLMLFAIGALTSLHCLFMCGGINLSVCLPPSAERPAKAVVLRSGLLYNLGRVAGYTAVGALVGALGSVLVFSGVFKGTVQLLAGVFMVLMGLSLLGILPTLRLPFGKGLAKKAQGKGPLIVGLLNALMPCGPLQAMQLYALASGSALIGATSMFVFALGTVPLMLGLGVLGSSLTARFTARATRVGAVLICVLGLFMFSTGLTLSGLSNSLDRMGSAHIANLVALVGGQPGAGGQAIDQAQYVNGHQVVDSTLGRGYPNIAVEAGSIVQWTIHADEEAINGCNNRLLIPAYGIEHSFTPGENLIEFTPTEPGSYTYSCWMGMIKGVITVS
jgi:sulfite exporter TauE/SafE